MIPSIPPDDERRKEDYSSTPPPPRREQELYDYGEPEGRGVIVTSGNDLPGYRVTRFLGVVRGIVVRSPSIAQGFLGGLKQIIGGNIEAYAEVCEAARKEAFDRMVTHAEELNADAVIAFRYDATEFTQSVTEVLAYGTAVKIRRT
jgi:uncharacterized protein YbjQ (UPF0145 family)